MFGTLYLVFAVAQAAIWFWGLRLGRRSGWPLWKARGWRPLALAAGAMFAAAAGGPARGTFAPPVANVGEIALVAALIATAARFAPEDATARGPRGRSDPLRVRATVRRGVGA